MHLSHCGASHLASNLGLIGGMSWRSTALYHRRINELAEEKLGLHHNVPSTIVSLEYAELLRFAQDGQWDNVERQIIAAGRKLVDAGCDVVALTAVTAHRFHEALQKAIGRPILHVLTPVAAELDRLRVQSVGVLGTVHTCKAAFTPQYLGRARNVVFLTDEDQAAIEHLINARLTVGDVRSEDHAIVTSAIEKLQGQGAQAVVLACTELPLLLPIPNLSPNIAVLDAVTLHAQSLLEAVR